VQYSNSKEIEVEFERPPLPRFVHELYKECARQCWTHAYLFKTYKLTDEQQARNRRDIDGILDVAFDTTLDYFLPWKSIIDKYFKEEKEAAPVLPATDMMEEEVEKKSVKFAEEEEESDEEEEGGGPPIMLSEETVVLDVEDLDKKEEEEVKDLVPSSEELVLNL
jgi:hypothetical protein